MAENSFQPSDKNSSSAKTRKEGQLIVDTATNFAIGIHGATAATAYKYAKEASADAAAKLANKVVPGSGAVIEFILDTGVSVTFNEGLEIAKDGEFFDDLAEDAGVALISNAAAAAVVGILGMSAAPALLTGLLVSSFMGAMYELTTSGGSIKERALGAETVNNQTDNYATGSQPQIHDDGSYLEQATGSSHRQSGHEFDAMDGVLFWGGDSENSSTNTNNPTSSDSTNQATNNNNSNTQNAPGNATGTPTQQTNNSSGGQGQTHNPNTEQGESSTGGSMTRTVDGVPVTHTDKETGKVTYTTGSATYTRGEQNEDGTYEWTLVIKTEVDGEPKESPPYSGTGRDDDNDGLPDEADVDGDGVPNSSDSAPTDASQQTPNPMNDNGDTSDYDGRYDGLRGFRGDIDYGPEGKQGQGYNGEHDELMGFDPRVDYGPDGKPIQGHSRVGNGLEGFDPRIDWDQDHVDTDEFTGNELTKRLSKINPRAIQEALEATTIAENGQQATEMGSTTSAFIFDSQAGVLYHNANGSKKGFGSGGAIADFEIDQDLSLVSIDFL